ncbi:hypothetical protein BDW68DRAFT_181921 [Aspergillus falconensis]
MCLSIITLLGLLALMALGYAPTTPGLTILDDGQDMAHLTHASWEVKVTPDATTIIINEPSNLFTLSFLTSTQLRHRLEQHC